MTKRREHFPQVMLDSVMDNMAGASDAGRIHLTSTKLPKRHTCPQCDYSTINKSHLTEHYRIHTGEKPYSCSYCSYQTGDRSNLRKHIRIHTGDQLHSCPYCSFKAKNYNTLKSHMVIHMQAS